MKILLINNECMGRGDDELGGRLMGAFLRRVCAEERKPEKILFYNSGVKLLAEGSTVLDAIELLSKAGVDLMACGSCVHHFNLADKIDPAIISDMKTLVSILSENDDVVTI